MEEGRATEGGGREGGLLREKERTATCGKAITNSLKDPQFI